ncbi:MAG: TonB-dependent receptor [Salinivirgaceae bacterium]|nr:TonB-dependent receptor [Salinivirgaceae bacterium]
MKYTIVLVLFFISFSVKSQLHQNLKEIVVEGEAEKNAYETQKESGTAKLVVSSKDLNNFGHHAAGDVLKRLPRIVMQGPPSFNRNVMMAGLDKQFQCILINGKRPAGGEDYRDMKLDRIPMDLIERIEIIYNPPASMGADATIGAINVILKDAPEKRVISADISMDNTSTKGGINPEGAITYGDNLGKFSFLGSYSLNNFQRENILKLSDGEISGEEIENLDVWIHGLIGDFNYKLDSTSSIKLHSYFTRYSEANNFSADAKRRTKGGLNTTIDNADDTKLRLLHSHTLTYDKSFDKTKWSTDLSIAQHFDQKIRTRKRLQSEGFELSDEDEGQVNTELRFLTSLSSSYKRHKFSLGLEASTLVRDYDRLVLTKMEDHMFWDGEEDGSYDLNENRMGSFIRDEFKIGKFWISPALRFDYDYGDYKTADTIGNLSYTSLNPSLHTKYSLTDKLFVKTDIARQISRPPFNLEVPIDKIKHKKVLIERGNPDLEPSRAWNFGVGVEKYFGDKSYVIGRGFYTIMRDLVELKNIGIDPNYNYNILQSVNIDSGLVWGIDIDTRLDLSFIGTKGLAFMGNISWLGSEVRDPGTFELRKLNYQPEWIANGSLDYINTRYKFQFSLGANYVGERSSAATVVDGVIVDAHIQGEYIQCDARIKYFFSTWGSVYLNVINIFDEANEFQQGAVHETEIIGRNLVLGVSLHF